MPISLARVQAETTKQTTREEDDDAWLPTSTDDP